MQYRAAREKNKISGVSVMFSGGGFAGVCVSRRSLTRVLSSNDEWLRRPSGFERTMCHAIDMGMQCQACPIMVVVVIC